MVLQYPEDFRSHADMHPSYSEFLQDSTVQHIRTQINDSTTYAAPYVCPPLFNICFRELTLDRIVQPVQLYRLERWWHFPFGGG